MSAIWKTQQWPQDQKRSIFIPIPKKGNAKNVQSTIELCSFLMLASLCSKSFKLGSSSSWTKNFQMYKLSFEETEELEITLLTFVGSWRKQRSCRKTSISASLTTLKPLTVWITTNCRKFLKWWEYETTLPVSWETYMWVRKQQLEPDNRTMDWFKIGKGVCQGCILSPCLFNLYAEYIMQNIQLDESQARIKIAKRNINNLRYADDTTLMAESKEELKSLLMRVKEES